MASMGGGQLDYEPLVRTIKSTSIVNKLLVAICAAERIPKAGVKQDLQNRIAQRK